MGLPEWAFVLTPLLSITLVVVTVLRGFLRGIPLLFLDRELVNARLELVNGLEDRRLVHDQGLGESGVLVTGSEVQL